LKKVHSLIPTQWSKVWPYRCKTTLTFRNCSSPTHGAENWTNKLNLYCWYCSANLWTHFEGLTTKLLLLTFWHDISFNTDV